MIKLLREQFNRSFSHEKYNLVCEELERASGTAIEFRIAETPLFISHEVGLRVASLAEGILKRAASDQLQNVGNKAIPYQWRYGGETSKPLFAAVDFAITGSAAAPDFKLIELQGFPSLYHYQPQFSATLRDVYGLPSQLSGMLDPSFGIENYYDALRQAIVGDCDPSEVILLEIDPHHQKTRCDFYLAAAQLGIDIVDIREVHTDGNRLVYEDSEGVRRNISRIYNRSIVDELVRRNVSLKFDIARDYDVQWAGHPNWYFKISKALLPHLVGTNEAVPRAFYLDEVNVSTLDLTAFVLKPLYSFAGIGVNVTPTIADINAIPDIERHNWLLQEKVQYADVIHTPNGDGVRAELRALLLWLPEWDAPKAVHTLVRLTRGKMIGVDFNKGLDWVGSSCALVATS
jgi:hypothetical protein